MAGAVVGIGLGFPHRPRSLRCLPFVLTVALLVPSALWRLPARSWRCRRLSGGRSPSSRSRCSGVLLGEGSNIGPVALLGLIDADFDRPLEDRAVDLRVRRPVQRFARFLDRQQLRHPGRGPAARCRSRDAGVRPAASMGYLGAARPGVPGRSRDARHRRDPQDDSEVLSRFVARLRPPGGVARLRRASTRLRGTVSSRLAPVAIHRGLLAAPDRRLANPNVRAACLVVLDGRFCRSGRRPVPRAALLLPAVHSVVGVCVAGADRLERRALVRKTDTRHAARAVVSRACVAVCLGLGP